jgi:hypothetical protein
MAVTLVVTATTAPSAVVPPVATSVSVVVVVVVASIVVVVASVVVVVASVVVVVASVVSAARIVRSVIRALIACSLLCKGPLSKGRPVYILVENLLVCPHVTLLPAIQVSAVNRVVAGCSTEARYPGRLLLSLLY